MYALSKRELERRVCVREFLNGRLYKHSNTNEMFIYFEIALSVKNRCFLRPIFKLHCASNTDESVCSTYTMYSVLRVFLCYIFYT